MNLPFRPSPLTVTAIEAANAAGQLLREGFGKAHEITSKPGKHNLVTECDKSAEALIIKIIETHFSDHSILGEEGGMKTRKGAKITWIIDPLDGTVNFAHHLPLFCVSIAAADEKEILTGVIYQPLTDELFVAEKGQGAFLNGKRIRVTETQNLEESILGTGFPYNANENPGHCIDQFVYLTQLGMPIRDLGTAALHLAYVAAGRFDCYWYEKLQPWDIAAGKLLIEEAGGKATHLDGSPIDIFNAPNLLFTNGCIHRPLLELLNKVLPRE